MLLRAAVRCLTTRAAAAYSSSTTVGMAKSVYAVVAGRRPGLYRTWDQCLAQVNGFPGNKYKGFQREEEALAYLAQHGIADAAPPPPPAALETAPAAAPAAAKGAGRPAAPRKRKQAAPAGGILAAAAAAAPATQALGPLPPTDRVLRLEFDGASRRNPGPSGFGAVLYDEATGTEVTRLCQYIGDFQTNNQAEYAGLIAGLQAALELGCRRIRVQGDSTLIIKQVLGQWQVKNAGLQPYHRTATDLMHRFASFEARQVLRHFNKTADALSNQAIDDYRSGANPHVWRLDAAAAFAGDSPLRYEEEEEDATDAAAGSKRAKRSY